MSKVGELGVCEVGGYLLLYTFILNTFHRLFVIFHDNLQFGEAQPPLSKSGGGLKPPLPPPRFSTSVIYCTVYLFHVQATSSSVSRRTGSMASMSGGDDMVYMEYRTSNPQHPLFKLRRH